MAKSQIKRIKVSFVWNFESYSDVWLLCDGNVKRDVEAHA